jgi:hypothetical protein
MTADAVAPAEIADVLDKAADEIQRRGFIKGDLYDEAAVEANTATMATCRVCAVGALQYVTTGSIEDSISLHRRKPPIFGRATIALDETLVERFGEDARDVVDFNDDPATTQDDVINLFRTTATNLRNNTPGAPAE